MTKEKWVQIILTALISAGIAFLQNLLAGLGNIPILETNPTNAGLAGAIIGTIKVIKFC
jgi:hypothetical protein